MESAAPMRPERAKFGFEFLYDTLSFGPLEFEVAALPVTSLYGQRGATQKPRNREDLLRLYWMLAQGPEGNADRAAQETLLLAALVPEVRVEGSRKIFADAFTSKRSAAVGQLDEFIRSESNQRCTLHEFENAAREMLALQGKETTDDQDFTTGESAARVEMTATLLDPACAVLTQGKVQEARACMLERWKYWMKAIAARRQHFAEKVAMNIISYECRAALHRCYSAAWSVLGPKLARERKWPPVAQIFHAFWNTIGRVDDQGQTRFHGHVFALHPASKLLLKTEAGRALIGAWLAEPDYNEQFERLLHGLRIAVTDYALRRADEAAERQSDGVKAATRLRPGDTRQGGEPIPPNKKSWTDNDDIPHV